jgi:hypothetical protein
MMASAQSAVLPRRLPVRRVVAITQLDSVIKTGNTGVPEEKQALGCTLINKDKRGPGEQLHAEELVAVLSSPLS